MLIGQGNKDNVKPISPYSNNPQSVVYNGFIDYKSGKILKGVEYWKNLADTILEYVNHPESKFVNGDKSGVMERRHITNGEIVYIGKETKNIEEQSLNIEKPLEYIDEKRLKKKISNMTPKQARELGIKHRSTLLRIKDRIIKGKKIKWGTKYIKKLINVE